MTKKDHLNILRFSSIGLVFIAIILELLEFLHDTVLEGIVYTQLGYILFVLVLAGALILSLIAKHFKSIAFLLASLKLFDSIYYSQVALRKFQAGFTNPLEATSNGLFGFAALFLFLSFIFFSIEKIWDKAWGYKVVCVTLSIASLSMLAGAIIHAITSATYGNHWSYFLEPFAVFILLTGLLLAQIYIENAHKENI